MFYRIIQKSGNQEDQKHKDESLMSLTLYGVSALKVSWKISDIRWTRGDRKHDILFWDKYHLNLICQICCKIIFSLFKALGQWGRWKKRAGDKQDQRRLGSGREKERASPTHFFNPPLTERQEQAEFYWKAKTNITQPARKFLTKMTQASNYKIYSQRSHQN